jgi:serine/threonine-protein kinase HipA
LLAAELVAAGAALPDDLAAAAGHGTSIGGARPKALLEYGGRHLIAKFSSTTDIRPVVKAEAAAMLLAARAGITVAPVEVRQVDGRDVLLVERFDRTPEDTRRAMVSALTFLGLAELESRHSSYAELAEAIRVGPWFEPAATLRELYTRLVFNVCVGNNDDHLRNHAAFWDGTRLALTPAYDLAPSPRSTSVSSQAVGISRDGRRASQLWLCREVAPDFLLGVTEAQTIIDRVVATIRADWDEVCDQALLTRAERDSLWQREFLNPYVFYDRP